jgi:hypothetical protein
VDVKVTPQAAAAGSPLTLGVAAQAANAPQATATVSSPDDVTP